MLRTRRANGDGTITAQWATTEPIYSDTIAVAVGPYVEFGSTYRSPLGYEMPLSFFVYPKELPAAKEDFSVVPEILVTFEEILGRYPFAHEKYGIAEFFISSFREHQTIPSYGRKFITGDHANDAVIAHEIAHQLFGNSLSLSDWREIWLNEGFATYAAALWMERRRGRAAYLDQIKEYAAETSKVEPSALIPASAEHRQHYFTAITFYKGALVLHLLRATVGDDAFFRGVHLYVQRFSRGTVRTADFRDCMQTAAGRDLQGFVDRWVYGDEIPTLNIERTPGAADGYAGAFDRLEQTPQASRGPTGPRSSVGGSSHMRCEIFHEPALDRRSSVSVVSMLRYRRSLLCGTRRPVYLWSLVSRRHPTALDRMA